MSHDLFSAHSPCSLAVEVFPMDPHLLLTELEYKLSCINGNADMSDTAEVCGAFFLQQPAEDKMILPAAAPDFQKAARPPPEHGMARGRALHQLPTKSSATADYWPGRNQVGPPSPLVLCSFPSTATL